ncbi:MAG: AAA family ATPase [Muribaculaceae bacterium]|nr:AAA family ATPase [Muribaculaceae bacterium]
MERYGIGIQDFNTIRSEGYVYVDKTQYIPKLLSGSKYYFLARPRRFGKSLFLSTLEYFFSGERELFKGLSVDSYDWDWIKYPVIHIDLNGSDYTQKEGLTSKLESILLQYEKLIDSPLGDNFGLGERFISLIIKLYEKTGNQVVVLVDEYEKPILDALDNPEVGEKHKATLRAFYGVLKSMDKYLKFVFLTGVTKFGQMNVFSGLNNILDISMQEEYGALCGVTQEELEKNFKEGIERIAQSAETDYERALHLLKENYDGYHFCRNCPDIYNPYSLINAFTSKEILAYWSYTGTPTLLVKLMMMEDYNLEKLDGVTASTERLLGIYNRFEDPVALFYQTGYLTIKGYDPDLKEYILGYPNIEVQKTFFNFVLPFYYSRRTQATESIISNLTRGIIKGEPQKAMETLESFSASISYDLIPAPDVERHFQSMLYIVVKLLSSATVKITPEWKTSDGRIDLLIETPKFVYIIEIKRDSTPDKALRQIKEKNYSLQFRNDSREVYLIGMNFSTVKRRLDGFMIEKPLK